MKKTPFFIYLFCSSVFPQSETTIEFEEVADKLAECVGTYQYAAEIMKQESAESSRYLLGMARGAGLASAMLLRIRDEELGRSNSSLETHTDYIEALANSKKSRLDLLSESDDEEIFESSLQTCATLKGLQMELVKKLRQEAGLDND